MCSVIVTENEPLLRITSTSGRLSLHILVTIFGISAWLGINSILTELPVIVQEAPEGWKLPSHIMIVIQLGNFAPIILMELKKRFKLSSYVIIVTLLVGGIGGCLMVAKYSNKTLFLFGDERSVPIFSGIFIFSLIGYSSLILFIPFIGLLKEGYLISYFFGESLSALIPGVLALLQGIDNNNQCTKNNTDVLNNTLPSTLFGVDIFFCTITFVIFSSLFAFVIINTNKTFKHEFVPLIIESVSKDVDCNNNTGMSPSKISIGNKFILFAILSVSFSLYSGILPSIQSFSCMPYGSNVYHLSVTLSKIANPVVCFSGHYFKHTCQRIKRLSIIMALLDIFLITTAIVHIHKENLMGISIIIILTWVITPSLHSFIRLSICAILRNEQDGSLEKSGTLIQVSAFFGALIGFILVNYTTWFSSFNPCGDV